MRIKNVIIYWLITFKTNDLVKKVIKGFTD